METKSLVRYSSLQCPRRDPRTSFVRYSSLQCPRRDPGTRFSQRRCMAVHVGSGERDRVRNGPDLALRRTRSDTEIMVPDNKKNQIKENQRIRDHYRELLQSDPGNSLVLTNYGKFLHKVEGDVKGAMECYERAIVAGDTEEEKGEAMALYGKLIWEAEKEKERAESYMERAVQASPNDCYVLGSYAHFLWEAEESDTTPDSNLPLD